MRMGESEYMAELLRVFGRRNFIILLLLVFLNTGIFILCADPERIITRTGEELEQYLENYPRYIEKTIKTGKLRGSMKLYQEGFAADYLQKSISAYEALRDIEVTYGDNRGLVLFFQYHLSELFALVFGFVIVMDFFSERKKGLDNLIRSTVKGRSILFLQRVVILALASLISVAVLFGFTLIGVKLTFGAEGLNRLIQSIPEYQKCVYPFSIGQYIIYTCAIKAAGIFFACILLYTVLGLFGKFISTVLVIVLFAGEIALTLTIDPVSSLNAFRYINIYTLIRTDDFFTGCVYLNLFGNAVHGLKAAFIVLGILTFILVTVSFIVNGIMHVRNSRTGNRITGIFRRIAEKFALQRSLAHWELYKTFILQGALFIFAGLLGIHIYMSYRYEYIYPVDAMNKLYYIQYHGEITRELYEEAVGEMQRMEDTYARLKESLAKAQSAAVPNAPQIYNLTILLEHNEADRNNLQPVLEDMTTAIAYNEATGRNLWLVEPFTYDLFINRDERTRRRASFLALIVIIGGLAGIYSYDRQNRMGQQIHSSYRGRNVQKILKPSIAVITGAVTVSIFHLIQYIHLSNTYVFSDFDVPVQSIPFMRDFSLEISIRGYLILVFAVRALAGIAAALITALISHSCSDRFSSIGIAVLVFAIGIFAAELIPAAGFIDITQWMSTSLV